MIQKNVYNKKYAPKLVFFIEKKIEKDSDDFCLFVGSFSNVLNL